MEQKKCTMLVEGKECGLRLTKIDWETDLGIYECARGHYSYVWKEQQAQDSS
jgi:hypothetical protein